MTNFDAIKSEYLPNIEDDDRLLMIKEKLFSLTEAEQRIFLTYLDEGTYAGVARFYGCSSPTAKKYIKRILEKFRE